MNGSLFRVKRMLSQHEKLNVIWGIYGSVTNFEVRLQTPTQVARDLNIKVQTVFSLVKNLEIDFDVKRVVERYKRPDLKRIVIIDDRFENFLKSKLCLVRWAHLTIAERVIRI